MTIIGTMTEEITAFPVSGESFNKSAPEAF